MAGPSGGPKSYAYDHDLDVRIVLDLTTVGALASVSKGKPRPVTYESVEALCALIQRIYGYNNIVVMEHGIAAEGSKCSMPVDWLLAVMLFHASIVLPPFPLHSSQTALYFARDHFVLALCVSFLFATTMYVSNANLTIHSDLPLPQAQLRLPRPLRGWKC